MLFGLLFFIPFFGMAVGTAMGALSGKFADYGINDSFNKEVRDKVTEGTSALFLLTSDAVPDRIQEAFEGVSAELIQSNLTSGAGSAADGRFRQLTAPNRAALPEGPARGRQERALLAHFQRDMGGGSSVDDVNNDKRNAKSSGGAERPPVTE